MSDLRSVPDLPSCPHCGSTQVASGFSLDWIEVPAGSWSCSNCGSAFIPEAWPKMSRKQRRAMRHGDGLASQLDHGPRQGG